MAAPTIASTVADDLAVADRLVDAVTTADTDTLRRLLADDVWFRALLVREVVECHQVDETISWLHGWYGTAAARELLHRETTPVATRIRVAWQVRLRPAWAPDVWHVIEQSGYARIADGRVRRLDLGCTGFVPEPELPPELRGDR
jgi:hypothetical protein